MHMLEDQRREGPHPVRDFISKTMFGVALESSSWVCKALSDSGRKRNHLQLSRHLLNIVLLGRLYQTEETT